MNKEEYSSTMANNIIKAISTFKAAMEGNGLDVVSIGLSPKHCAQISFYCTAAIIKGHSTLRGYDALTAFKINHTITQGAILGVEITSVHPSDSAEAQK